MNLVKLIEDFGSEGKCRDYLEELRWPDGPSCPRCESCKISTIGERDQFDCSDCRYQFSVTSQTIMHGSKVPLWKWLLTAYMMCESRKGISANQVKRTIGVGYKTAWYLCHRIRAAMAWEEEGQEEPLGGTVEIDETLVGGPLSREESASYLDNKTIVAGVFQRGGRVRLKVIPKASRAVLHQFIRENVRPDTEAIYTDELAAYKGVADHDTKHETVNHSRKVWARGDVHTNGIENVWSLLKRSILGAFHHVSGKHLDAYLDELEWRFNNRKNEYLFRDTVLRLLGAEPMPYADLVGKPDEIQHRFNWADEEASLWGSKRKK